MIKRKILVFTILVLLLIGESKLHSKANGKNRGYLDYNVLFITCEDISPMIGAFGDSIAFTPNLDKLAKDGIIFNNVFSVSGVCAPSRSALITGMYPTSIGSMHMRVSNNNIPNGIKPYETVPPTEVKCFTEYLREAGYYCTNNEKTDYQFVSPITAWDENGAEAHWKNRPKGMRFFSVFNLLTTHESQIRDRENDPLVVLPENVSLPPYYPDSPAIRKDISTVYKNITVMDREVGELIDELKKEGIYDNTIIVFLSDNGGPMPRGKREIYDSGIHVPMIIRFPNNEFAGTVNDDLISFVDFAPTFLSLLEIPIPDYMQGQAFLGKNKAEKRDYIFAARDRMDEFYDTRRAVRDKQFKYIRNYRPDLPAYQDLQFRKKLASMRELLLLRDSGKLNDDQIYYFRKQKLPEELYDLSKDPHELNNLINENNYREHLERLRNVHLDWQLKYGDLGMMPEIDLVNMIWPDGEQPITSEPVIKTENNIVSIFCETEGASIAYQINGKGLNENHWFLYSKPFQINKEDKVTAVAIRIGFKQSDVICNNN